MTVYPCDINNEVHIDVNLGAHIHQTAQRTTNSISLLQTTIVILSC